MNVTVGRRAFIMVYVTLDVDAASLEEAQEMIEEEEVALPPVERVVFEFSNGLSVHDRSARIALIGEDDRCPPEVAP